MDSTSLVQKLWNACNVLRGDGMSYGDYVEQLTHQLLLKTANERSRPPWKQPSPLPVSYGWSTLLSRERDDLFDHYRYALNALGSEKGHPRACSSTGRRTSSRINPP